MRMRNEEAIKSLKKLKSFHNGSYGTAIYLAIKALEQQPSEDCISRAEAINVVHKYFMDYLKLNDDICLDGIRSLPSVTPQHTRWIPVTERLPKAYEFVNCTCHSLIDDREDWVIETAYIPQPSDSPYSDWGNIPMLNSGDCKVVAWMHRDIPEPYEAESEVNADGDSN